MCPISKFAKTKKVLKYEYIYLFVLLLKGSQREKMI